MKEKNIEINLAELLFYVAAYVSIASMNTSGPMGTIVYMLLIFLTFTGSLSLCIPMILVANDALGTAFLGRISFYWAVLLLILIDFLRNKRGIKKSAFCLFGVGLLYFIHTLLFQYDLELRAPLQIFAYFIISVYLMNEVKANQISKEQVLSRFGLSIFVLALHMAITGGIDFSTFGYSNGSEWIRTTRYGLLGVGTGDPNFSGFRLLVGALCIAYSNCKLWIKVGMIGVIAYCIIRAASLTSILVCVLMIAMSVLLMKGVTKKIKWILLGVAIVIVAIIFLYTIPLGDSLSSHVSLIQHRIESTWNSVLNKDLAKATSGRTNGASQNIDYIFGADRSIFHFLFGFEKFPAPGTDASHVTYLDWLLRFGLIGCIGLIIIMVECIYNRYKEYKHTNSRTDCVRLLICILYTLYLGTLSVYNNTEPALLSFFLIL